MRESLSKAFSWACTCPTELAMNAHAECSLSKNQDNCQIEQIGFSTRQLSHQHSFLSTSFFCHLLHFPSIPPLWPPPHFIHHQVLSLDSIRLSLCFRTPPTTLALHFSLPKSYHQDITAHVYISLVFLITDIEIWPACKDDPPLCIYHVFTSKDQSKLEE